MLNWNTSKEDHDIIVAIAKRYEQALKDFGKESDRLKIIMDVEATHNNGCPLNLKGLLDADMFNFVHDVGGIQTNINRKTGKLENCFLPRYAKGE